MFYFDFVDGSLHDKKIYKRWTITKKMLIYKTNRDTVIKTKAKVERNEEKYINTRQP
jgi:hypothetical protein